MRPYSAFSSAEVGHRLSVWGDHLRQISQRTRYFYVRRIAERQLSKLLDDPRQKVNLPILIVTIYRGLPDFARPPVRVNDSLVNKTLGFDPSCGPLEIYLLAFCALLDERDFFRLYVGEEDEQGRLLIELADEENFPILARRTWAQVLADRLLDNIQAIEDIQDMGEANRDDYQDHSIEIRQSSEPAVLSSDQETASLTTSRPAIVVTSDKIILTKPSRHPLEYLLAYFDSIRPGFYANWLVRRLIPQG